MDGYLEGQFSIGFFVPGPFIPSNAKLDWERESKYLWKVERKMRPSQFVDPGQYSSAIPEWIDIFQAEK